MATDLSRVRHDPYLDWAGVQLKQGGVLLDADVNELVAVLDRRFRALASDVLGRATVSQTTPEAFRITLASGDLEIGRGRLYVDGLLAENHGGGTRQFDPLLAEPRSADPLRYGTQPYLPSPPTLPTSGRHLVYLDVWNREVTPLERPDLVDGAVGIDTGSRIQTVWQVRVLPEEVGANTSCATPDQDVPGWAALTAPSEGRLTTGTFEVPPLDNPCELPPTGGYRGLENQLYRVEIHDPGLPGGGATFKWSRENASVGSRVASFVSSTELELETLGRDDVLGFASGDWVEIVDDVREFSQRPGEMRRIDIPDPSNRRITFSPALPADLLPASFPDSVTPGQRNLRVRRWDQRGKVFRTAAGGTTVQAQDLDASGSTGLINVPAAGTELLLENGVTVSFSSTGTHGFKRGDWWVFAARTSDATVEELDAAPPRGIHHHYARLGIWDVAAETVSDCRNPWPPEGGHDCACTVCVTPESHASGALTIQAAVDRVRETGGVVCLQVGTYALREPVRIKNGRSIAIRGQGAATIITAPGTAFLIETGIAIAIEKLSVVSLGQGAAIDVRTALGLGLRELLLYVFNGNGDLRNAAISLSGLCAGVTVEDNLLIAPEGIRTNGERTQEAGLPFALLAAVSVERNVFSCQRTGIALTGTTGHLWETRIAGNQFADCPRDGIVASGIGLPGSSLRIADNNLNIEGNGITCGVGGAWIESNRLHFSRRSGLAVGGHGIILAAGLERAGAERMHVLANQITGFSGTGVAIRMPVRDLIVKLNVISACGNGIVMEASAESDAVSIENNHLRALVGTPAGIALGIAVARTEAATVAGNQIREIGRSGEGGRALSVGVLMIGVNRSRIHGHEVSEIGPSVNDVGRACGILVFGPLAQAEISGNHVRRDDALEAGGGVWYALFLLGVLERNMREVGATTRAVNVSAVRVDERRTLVIRDGRAFVSTAALDPIVKAARTRGAVAIVMGNILSARGDSPAVDVRTDGEIMFSDNRCELVDNADNPAVRLETPVLILNANRARNLLEPTIEISSGEVAAVGNITSRGIGGLPSIWTALNVTA